MIAAGTGLGEAIVVDDGRARTVIASEGGHADFGPRGELQEDLLRYLRAEFGSVSYERVLSGPGLVNVYRFLRDTGVAKESAPAAALMRERDPAAVVTDLGTLPGGHSSGARAINAAGQVVGASETAAHGSHATLWTRK